MQQVGFGPLCSKKKTLTFPYIYAIIQARITDNYQEWKKAVTKHNCIVYVCGENRTDIFLLHIFLYGLLFRNFAIVDLLFCSIQK